MALDGVLAAQARVAELTSRLRRLDPAAAPDRPAGAAAAAADRSSFASLLADAERTAPASGLGPVAGALAGATRLAPGRYGTLEPPAALVAYGNGRIPAGALEEIGIGGHRLHAPAAQAFRRMRADAAAQGVDLGVTDSYRGYEQQVALAQKKGLYSQGGLAATPGRSNHGWGMAARPRRRRQGPGVAAGQRPALRLGGERAPRALALGVPAHLSRR